MTDNYVSLYLQSAFASENYLTFLALLFLFMGRMLPIITFVPFFGGKLLPRPVKITFALSIFAIFLPQLLTEVTTPIALNYTIFLLLAKEVFIGILLGFFLNIPFVVVQCTGILIDHQRGGSSLMVNDPTMQNQSSPLGTLFNYVLIYLFFLMEGPFTVLEILSQSFTIIPPDKLFNAAIFHNPSVIFQNVIKVLGKIIILATQLASPALIMILMTDFFLGIANRLAPQVQITFLGMPLKSLLALTVVFFGWTLFAPEIASQAQKALQFAILLIQQFKSL